MLPETIVLNYDFIDFLMGYDFWGFITLLISAFEKSQLFIIISMRRVLRGCCIAKMHYVNHQVLFPRSDIG
jgi:hypothetical protein